jgi:hypothetical protein
VAEEVIASFLGVGARGHEGEAALADAARAEARARAEAIARELAGRPPLDAAGLARLRERVKQRQDAAGYGDYATWIARVTPPDLE